MVKDDGEGDPPPPPAKRSKPTRNERRGGKRNRKRPRSSHSLPPPQYTTTIQPLGDSSSWLRTVEPYPYTFTSFAKARWVGRTILDVYVTEFGSYPQSYYELAMAQGRILVSDRLVDRDYRICAHDVLSHTVHRHEPGVAVASPHPPHVRVVHETSHVLVVDKPGTLPVHACGGYHVQSLMAMLLLQEAYFGGGNNNKLYTIHRLDRLTSGLVLLGKTAQVAKQWGMAIQQRTCRKTYLARVKGRFPSKCCGDKRIPFVGTAAATAAAARPAIECGEWVRENDDDDDDAPTTVSKLRRRHAHAIWISHQCCEDEQTSEDDKKDPTARMDQFSNHHQPVDAWLQQDVSNKDPASRSSKSSSSNNSCCWLHLACPTRIAQPKDGICEAGTFDELDDALYLKTVKPAETAFGIVAYDATSDTTLLVCRPMTGRTHQIRLHLQYLGHGIANDPNYGGEMWYGNPKGEEACKLAQEQLNAWNNDMQASDDEPELLTKSDDHTVQVSSSSSSFHAMDVPATEQEVQQGVSSVTRGDTESIHEFVQRTCLWCARIGRGGRRRHPNGGKDRAVLEFQIRSPGIWLHALEYKFDGAEVESEETVQGRSTVYRAPLPSWASMG